MTALKEYERLEAIGLWKESPDAQRREVVVSFGDATLVLSDQNDAPLAHWSLAAIKRINRGKEPAIYSPDADPFETVEISDELMIQAIEKIRSMIRKSRPHPGRLRGAFIAALILVIGFLGATWLPNTMARYAARVVPEEKARQIGADLMKHVTRLTGDVCSSELGNQALGKLRHRLRGPSDARIYVLDMGGHASSHLPGGAILINRFLLEEQSGPDIAAGYILYEQAVLADADPVFDLMKHAGTRATITFLATGNISEDLLRTYAAFRLTESQTRPEDADLLAEFAAAKLSIAPFAHALDPSTETTQSLIDQDPKKDGYPALLTDGEWISLQAICAD